MSTTTFDNHGQEHAPDVETASEDYASRFAGRAGDYMLGVQSKLVGRLISSHQGGTLMDVGGGHGQLRDLYDGLAMRYTLQGSSGECFSRLDACRPGESRVVSDLRALPFPDQSFDVVVSVRLIPHLTDWAAVLAEMCRTARKAVVIDYPSKRSLNALTPLLFPLKKGVEGNTRTYLSFTRNQFRDVLEANGFHIAGEIRQFFVPMMLHRATGSPAALQYAERLARGVGLTRMLGSPALLCAVRDAIE